MPTSDRRGRRRDQAVPSADPSGTPDAPDGRGLLARILDTPQLAHVVPRLQPEVLHRVIETCGLEDCGDLVALATPGQLQRVFDLDLWRTPQPGLDEQLDAGRFAVWLDVLLESGDATAAQKLASMEAALVIAALAEHVRVFDLAAVSFVSLDGEPVAQRRSRGDRLECEIGSYLIEARRTDAWDTIVATLIALNAEQPEFFHRVMGGCRRLSNAGAELDGLDDLLQAREQDMFDLTIDRERRREQQGYVTAPQARAFLQMARELETGHGTAPPTSPITHAYFRAIDPPSSVDDEGHEESGPSTPDSPAPAEAVGAIVDLLCAAGCLPQAPRALLEAVPGETARFVRIKTLLQSAAERDYSTYSTRTEELAYLANTIVAGCSIQARAFTTQEASDAAVAICNLGLENWPSHWLPDRGPRNPSESATALPEDFLVSHDLSAAFQVGWMVLYRQVAMHAAERLIHVLADLRTTDRDTQAGLNTLRFEMTRQWRAGTPWRARDALDVLVILDMPAWAVLLGLIDECPVRHAVLGTAHGSRPRSVNASAFEFISENSQIASIHRYLDALSDTLRS